jgi:hypothetical protein
MVEFGFETEFVKVGSAGGLIVAAYRSSTKDDLERLDAYQGAVLAKHGRIASMSVMENVSPMARMDEATRQKGAELALKYAKTNAGGAIVVRSRGVGAVIARTSLSAIFLLTQGGLEMKVFKTIDEGLLWLRSLPVPNPLIGNAVTAADIDAFVKQS